MSMNDFEMSMPAPQLGEAPARGGQDGQPPGGGLTERRRAQPAERGDHPAQNGQPGGEGNDFSGVDSAETTAAREALISQWGGEREFQANVEMIDSLLVEKFGAEGAANLAQMRLPDGSLAGNRPEILNWLAEMARAAKFGGGDGGALAAGGGGGGGSPEERRAAIQREMESGQYWKRMAAEDARRR